MKKERNLGKLMRAWERMVIKFFLNLQQGKLRKVPEISDIQDATEKRF